MASYVPFDPEKHKEVFEKNQLLQAVSELDEERGLWIEKLVPVETREEFEAAVRVPIYYVVAEP